MKILLIDDHELIIDLVSALLHDVLSDVVVCTARDASGALRLLAENDDAGLMLLDLGVPGATGTSLLEAVLAQSPKLKVLVLSGWQDRQSVMRVLQIGAVGFVPKSMATDVLVAAIRLVLSGGIYIPSNLFEPMRCAEPPRSPTPRQFEFEPGSISATLTERQKQVLRLLSRGMPIKEVCRELGLSEGTVKTHVLAIYRAFGASNRTQALLAARRNGYDMA
jgi:DNA-binding NarL/FixJ family response regulator